MQNLQADCKLSWFCKSHSVWLDFQNRKKTQKMMLESCYVCVSRYGKRTIRGLLQDGFNSAARYYYNNFQDGNKQVDARCVGLLVFKHVC